MMRPHYYFRDKETNTSHEMLNLCSSLFLTNIFVVLVIKDDVPILSNSCNKKFSTCENTLYRSSFPKDMDTLAL